MKDLVVYKEKFLNNLPCYRFDSLLVGLVRCTENVDHSELESKLHCHLAKHTEAFSKLGTQKIFQRSKDIGFS